MKKVSLNLAFFALLLSPFLCHAVKFPLGVTNCHMSYWVDKPPQRAVTLNQGTTEVMLGLGLANRMVATAWLDDAIWPQYKADYDSIAEHFERYPNATELFDLEPDFLYASYSSAFRDGRINYTDVLPEAEECTLKVETSSNNYTYCRDEIHGDPRHIRTFLQEPFCEIPDERPEEGTVALLFDEIWTISAIFDVQDNARALVDSIDASFARAQKIATDGTKIRALWLDTFDHKDTGKPYVGSCCGSPQQILELAGSENVFADEGLDERKTWAQVEWDAVIETDPDLIVIIDASWDTAASKIHDLCSDSRTRELRAVQNRAYLIVPFSASTLGVRLGGVALNLAEAMTALSRGTALDALQFSEVTLGGDVAEALGQSGVSVYSKNLPVFKANETYSRDLNEMCPGTTPILEIREMSNGDEGDDDDSLPSWGVALIVVFGALVAFFAVALAFLVVREKKGDPLFVPIANAAGQEA